MLGLEVFEVALVICVISRLLVLGQLGIITVFHCLASALVRRLVIGSEYLPSLTDRLGDFCEAQILSFEMLSYFCKVCQIYWATGTHDIWRYLRLEKRTYADGGLSGAFSSGYTAVNG